MPILADLRFEPQPALEPGCQLAASSDSLSWAPAAGRHLTADGRQPPDGRQTMADHANAALVLDQNPPDKA